ncbi:hypothetical protein K438DRAFT_528389 [Mycena galopus ATCC 62051]|nr:hypothetical protein K438DRAFT_528389 [Mycena galopus ATCC 62051]
MRRGALTSATSIGREGGEEMNVLASVVASSYSCTESRAATRLPHDDQARGRVRTAATARQCLRMTTRSSRGTRVRVRSKAGRSRRASKGRARRGGRRRRRGCTMGSRGKTARGMEHRASQRRNHPRGWRAKGASSAPVLYSSSPPSPSRPSPSHTPPHALQASRRPQLHLHPALAALLALCVKAPDGLVERGARGAGEEQRPNVCLARAVPRRHLALLYFQRLLRFLVRTATHTILAIRVRRACVRGEWAYAMGATEDACTGVGRTRRACMREECAYATGATEDAAVVRARALGERSVRACAGSACRRRVCLRDELARGWCGCSGLGCGGVSVRATGATGVGAEGFMCARRARAPTGAKGADTLSNRISRWAPIHCILLIQYMLSDLVAQFRDRRSRKWPYDQNRCRPRRPISPSHCGLGCANDPLPTSWSG